MNDSQHSELLEDPEFQSILATCLEKLEQGEPLDREELVARHPQYASGLREFLDDHELLRRLAREAKSEQAAVTAAIEPTIAGGSSPLGVAIGETIQYVGEYRILGEIARGGMGVVFKARQRQLKRIVALKMILAGRLANEADVQRFQREAQAAARLQHPNIVPVHEVGEYEGHHYFTMDYVAGLNLAEVIRDEALSATRAAKIVKTLAEATHYAHEQDTLHRDLKPANVILDANDQPHITDFGLAKIATDNKDESGDDLTATGQVLGTPSYMSPEQAEGKQHLLGPATDTYALGAILYACLTGRAPFVADSPVDTLLQVVRNEPASPRLLNPSVPKDLETICLKCLAKEPHRRYGQARLLADDLARFLDGRPVLARPIGRSAMFARWCKRNPVVATLATTAAVLLIVGTVVSSYFAVRANMAADAEHTARLNAQASESRATRLATQMSDLAEEKASIAAAESQARRSNSG